MLAALVCCIVAIVLFQLLAGIRRTGSPSPSIASRQDVHLRRKAQHLITGLMIYQASGYFPPRAAVVVLMVCALVFYGAHSLRKASQRVNETYLSLFGGLLRREEIALTVLPGAFYFLLGCAVVLALFPTDIARLSILHLSVGDPSASLTGTIYRRTRGNGKSLEGFLGCFLISAVASTSTVWIDQDQDGTSVPLLLKLVFAGLCAATAEWIHLGWDDNLTLPILSSLFLLTGRQAFSLI